jgi:hypothetical protein
MLYETCKNFTWAQGQWNIIDYYDHNYYMYGYHSDYEHDDRNMTLVYTSPKMCDTYGIAEADNLQKTLRSIYDDDLQSYTDVQGLSYDEWINYICHINDYSNLVQEPDKSSFITSGRGEDNFDVYSLTNTEGEMVAFWLLPHGKKVADILCKS